MSDPTFLETAYLYIYQPYTFPPYITHTDLRPDLVLWNNKQKTVCLIELTICYETRFKEAHTLKKNKYAEVIEVIQATEFIPDLILLTVPPKIMFSCFYTFSLLANVSLPYSVLYDQPVLDFMYCAMS